MKILIRNLAREATQPELLALFEAHGRVQSCTIVMDKLTGGSKGFGFVNMPLVHEGKAAIKALNGLSVRGSRIRVKKAEAVDATASAAAQVTAEPESVPQQAPAESLGSRKSKKDGTPLGTRKPRTFRAES